MPAEVIQMIVRRLDTTELLQLTRTNQALRQYALDQLRINHVIILEGRAALIDFANMQAIIPGVRGEHITISNVRNVNAEAQRAVATIMSQPTAQSIHFERVYFINLV